MDARSSACITVPSGRSRSARGVGMDAIPCSFWSQWKRMVIGLEENRALETDTDQDKEGGKNKASTSQRWPFRPNLLVPLALGAHSSCAPAWTR